MQPVTLDQLGERLHKLPPEKLGVVYDFVSYLLDRDTVSFVVSSEGSARDTTLASEGVLRRDWDRPEEDAAWAHL